MLIADINKNVPEQIASDKQKIKQILFNLIGNALKFTPEGEVKLSVFIKNKEIFLEVKDSGIGISPEDQKKLFDMFQRSSHPLVRKIEGSGYERIGGEMKGERSDRPKY